MTWPASVTQPRPPLTVSPALLKQLCFFYLISLHKIRFGERIQFGRVRKPLARPGLLSVVRRPAAWAAPGSVSEMHNPRRRPGPPEPTRPQGRFPRPATLCSVLCGLAPPTLHCSGHTGRGAASRPHCARPCLRPLPGCLKF